MIHVALFEPEIPPNTGNIIRLCANAGASLHLIHPMGFDLSTKQCRRAGLDYHDMANVHEYENFDLFLEAHQSKRLFACTTKATQAHSTPVYQDEDILLFGPESRGLPPHVLDALPAEQKIRIPMQENSRSLNLSNATAVILYETLRQLNFPGLWPSS